MDKQKGNKMELSEYKLPVGNESTHEYYKYSYYYEALEILNPDAGPCITCDKPMVRLRAKQFINHNEVKYTQISDIMYAHADGSEPHAGFYNHPKAKCPDCSQYGTLTTQQLPYGDLTTCSHCHQQSYFPIGD